jgi:hypothetical protein
MRELHGKKRAKSKGDRRDDAMGAAIIIMVSDEALPFDVTPRRVTWVLADRTTTFRAIDVWTLTREE